VVEDENTIAYGHFFLQMYTPCVKRVCLHSRFVMVTSLACSAGLLLIPSDKKRLVNWIERPRHGKTQPFQFMLLAMKKQH